MRKIVCLMVALLLAATATGCGSSADADAYLGTWKSEGGMYMEFRDDGTFSKSRDASTIKSSPWEYGTYTFDGDVLHLTTAQDSDHCRGADASYEAELSEDGTFIAHIVIEDPCPGRASDFGKGIHRYR